MRKMLLTAVALGGLLGLTTVDASAAPVAAQLHAAPRASLVQADYVQGHHHYHHRRWSHGHWHYWD